LKEQAKRHGAFGQLATSAFRHPIGGHVGLGLELPGCHRPAVSVRRVTLPRRNFDGASFCPDPLWCRPMR
jgi:hypothetical protein